MTDLPLIDVEPKFRKISQKLQIGHCRQINEYNIIGVVGEGTYGKVYKAIDTKTSNSVALKHANMTGEFDGIPPTFLRELSLLRSIDHPNITHLYDVVVGPKASDIFLSFEFYEHTLFTLIKLHKHPFTESEIKCLMIQLLSALHYLHERFIIHRDVKMSNILYSNTGHLKLTDFGLARSIRTQEPHLYTPGVVTIWYRSPELLLDRENYDSSVDIWAAGCIFGELFLHNPILQGDSETEQLKLIFNLLGTPSESEWPEFSSFKKIREMSIHTNQPSNLKTVFPMLSYNGLNLLSRLLCLNPANRISAKDALLHPYFEESPMSKTPSMMPSYPASNVPLVNNKPATTEFAQITPRHKIHVDSSKSTQPHHSHSSFITVEDDSVQ